MKAYIETYGCQMNINESDVLRKRLLAEGYTFSKEPGEANLVLLNTCSIREHAESKVLSRLGVLRKLKEENPQMLLGVTGCMAQRLGGEFLAKTPFVDLVIGSGAYPRFFEALEAQKRSGKPVVDVGFAKDFQFEDHPEFQPGSTKTFITIIRGCDNACHYCIVPFTRGPERSKPLGQIIREAEWCVDKGIREITLLGQNVNHYKDGEFGLGDCLREVARVRGLHRVRYTTSHPGYMTDDVLVAMAEEEKVMPQLHLPMQSGSSRVLKAMNREYTWERYMELINRGRELMPNLALSTDIIVGFPGETDEDFRETVHAMEQVRFDSAFMFKFSPRRGTVAAGYEDDVPPKVKQERLAEIIALQRRITHEKSQHFVGQEVEVLIDGPSSRNPDQVVGKTQEFRNALMPGDPAWKGELVRMQVESAKGVTLTGKPVEALQPAAH
ncbi:MAG: tRNA (N6-isopentenyl adenosine(37)-C2)-methylthiotransferase MiaB [Candidatus Eisenbacteria bacterium]|uniref:tRNA-2-methylthio-N(6)-dimethylallyladenosine synthase n=1 Tax=Eiseniibacteriota bacterium TaxID=2212470 RepID=A0A7Y2H2Z5_UNCEI|nr:tRNA (N6-isopentenyl adenosine(37)-C2)-methylthiotransferase MiaB [Candidatus Eisenbacteria bacterium]